MDFVQVPEDIFIDACWERVNDRYPNYYPDEVWQWCFDLLSDCGWLRDANNNYPSYIVDNIAINGEIVPIADLQEYDVPEGVDVYEYAEEQGWSIVADYVIINMGV